MQTKDKNRSIQYVLSTNKDKLTALIVMVYNTRYMFIT